jgi:hypothetical protein
VAVFRKVVLVAAAVVAGPAISLLLVGVGCRQPASTLGELCGHHAFSTLVFFAISAWFVIAVAATLVHAVRNNA